MVYQEVYAATNGETTSQYMKGATVVENLAWLHQLCSPVMLQYSAPLTEMSLR